MKKRSSLRFAPMLARLEERTVPNGYIAAGAGYGAPPLVAIRVDKVDALDQGGINNIPGSGQNLAPTSDGKTDYTSDIFYAYNPGFTGGVSVATGNFDGDYTTPDWLVTGAGPGGGPHVIVWRTAQDGSGNITVTGIVGQFFAFAPTFTGGVHVATGDLDGDGRAELIVSAASAGGPEVKVYKFGTDGQFHQALAFYAFASNFTGGVTVASGQGYDTPFQIRQVINTQLTMGATTTPYNPASSRPGLNTTNANLDFPLFGGNGVTDTQDPTDPNPAPSNTLDSNGEPLPYFTVASGEIQYDGANLLNSFSDYAYTPNNYSAGDTTYPNDPPFNDPLVYATWSAMSMNPPDFNYTPGEVYGPFVETEPSIGSAPAQITRLVAPIGQVSAQNQLILGAGPGGGPEVRVLEIGSDGTQYGLKIENSYNFYAFDKNYTGGVNVAIGSFLSLPTSAGGTVTLNGHTYPAVTPDTTSQTIDQLQFPYSSENYTQFQAQILVTQMQGGGAVVWSNYDPNLSPSNPLTSITQLNLVPTFLTSQLQFNPNDPLNGFYDEQSSPTLPDAIDPQFTGDMLAGVSALTFGATNLYSSLAASARAQVMFGAGAGPAPSRGTEIKIFDDIGPVGSPVVGGGVSNNPDTDPIDQFDAFTSGYYPTGLGGIAFGFGSLPAPTRDIVELSPITVTTLSDPSLT